MNGLLWILLLFVLISMLYYLSSEHNWKTEFAAYKHANENTDLAELIHQADEAVYQAKASGRNCICVYEA
ncbi:GGDEF domain-containing protein [Thiomicrorhabdus sediminis]|uniref:GGDEF domain-containing protein n=1 Tax=Thiomicrorhabdus sediminis TaxID=2580412 RepID=A0A4P9K4E9_9GAMM|nr:GGDEF domain-containing protein [Thiomicrorhabdus sediminis]QCU89809.1 GGDEF domain-containing protein [Thiomicrorhabdus sediminis]